MRTFSEKLLKLILEDYQELNLTRITNPDEFYYKQIVDSNLVTSTDTFRNNKIEVWIDVGFGGGFPLLPLAYKHPEIKFIGLERKKKKVNAVQEIAKKLEIKNIKVYHEDIDKILIDQPNCFVSFKAVGRVEKLLPSIRYEQKCMPQVCFYKGPNFNKLEGDSLKKIAKDWKIVEDRLWELEGTDGRRIIFFEPFQSAKQKRWPTNLVRLSSIEQG